MAESEEEEASKIKAVVLRILRLQGIVAFEVLDEEVEARLPLPLQDNNN